MFTVFDVFDVFVRRFRVEIWCYVPPTNESEVIAIGLLHWTWYVLDKDSEFTFNTIIIIILNLGFLRNLGDEPYNIIGTITSSSSSVRVICCKDCTVRTPVSLNSRHSILENERRAEVRCTCVRARSASLVSRNIRAYSLTILVSNVNNIRYTQVYSDKSEWYSDVRSICEWYSDVRSIWAIWLKFSLEYHVRPALCSLAIATYWVLASWRQDFDEIVLWYFQPLLHSQIPKLREIQNYFPELWYDLHLVVGIHS